VNRNARLLDDVLDRIVRTKRDEVERLEPEAARLHERARAAPRAADFRAALAAGPHVAVIAEVKRRSPSAGGIAEGAAAADVAERYQRAGASAVSVLTDTEHFGGSLADLESVAERVSLPLLRKDFTVSDLQVLEARGAGAAAVLLIVRILEDAELCDLRALAGELGMAALVEVHDEAELERALAAGADIVGVNNRDLGTFTTDLGVTERLAAQVPPGVLLVAESGIRNAADVARLAACGADAVLIGETLMRATDPEAALRGLSSVPRRGR
jgi:indole-3-glycerol phosphate synthase